MSEIFILLPVHNRKEITRNFVECLCRQTFPRFHLVLIDDGSTDGTAGMVLSHVPNATVLHGNGELWWAGGLQMGLDWLKENCQDENAIVLMINDDVTFDETFLATAVGEMKTLENVMLLAMNSCDGGNSVTETGVRANFRRFDFRVVQPGESINCLPTRGLFLRFKDIKRIGDFYPKLLPHYWSDYEYTIRAVRRGLSCITSQSVYLCANEQATGHRQFNEMGRLEFLRKYFSKRSVLNPFYASAFVLLACPRQWAVQSLLRIWLNALKLCAKQMLRAGV